MGMHSPAPTGDVDPTTVDQHPRKRKAAGVPADRIRTAMDESADA